MRDASSLFRLDGRTALVTGAASGLGRAIALGFAGAGASVVAADRDAKAVEGLAAEAGATSLVLDVRDGDAVDRALAALPRLDVVVNSAGVSGSAPSVSLDETAWRDTLDVNLTGTFLVCRAAAPRLVEAGGGTIVNLASDLGLVGFPGMAAYTASKGGVVQLTRSLALEWGPDGIRVNALAPCTFETPMVVAARAERPERFDRFLAATPLGRFGRPEEIVGPALFLASDASSMVTGHVLAVDGGYLAQ